jgi:hypothetical protein
MWGIEYKCGGSENGDEVTEIKRIEEKGIAGELIMMMGVMLQVQKELGKYVPAGLGMKEDEFKKRVGVVWFGLKDLKSESRS